MNGKSDQSGLHPDLSIEVTESMTLESAAVIKNVYGFSVDPRFTDLVPIGQGGNGMVFSAIDSDCEKNVAIKKICFLDQKSCKYALRELTIMRQLQHENVVTIYEILGPNGFSMDGKHTSTPNSSAFNAFYIVQEHMDVSLSQLIQNATLSQDHIKFFLYQILRGLKYIHSANIIHRDIKPSNILLSLEDLVLKIGDFGLARVVDPAYCHRGYLTDRIGTCWYRAPELIITPRDYTSAIDIWGVGCVLGEMLTGQPLFPGAQEMEQIGQVLDCIPLNDNEWNIVTQVLPQTVMKKHKRFPQASLKSKLSNVESNAKDLMETLLVFSPNERPTAQKALSHPYLKQYSFLEDEPVVSRPFRIEHEVDDLPIEALRQMLIREGRRSPEGCGSQSSLIQGRQSCENPDPIFQTASDGQTYQQDDNDEPQENVDLQTNLNPQAVVRDKNSQSSCNSVKESLYIDISGIENAKEFCGLSPKEKADKINSLQRTTEKNNSGMSVKMKDRLNEKRRGRSPTSGLTVNPGEANLSRKIEGDWDDPSECVNSGNWPTDLSNVNDRLTEDKNLRNSPDSLHVLNREKSRSKESLFKKQMGRQKKSKQKSMNVRDFDNLYRLPTEHLRRHRRRTDDRLLSIKPKPEFSNAEKHVKLREEVNERLRLAELERDHIRGAVGGTCTLDEIVRPIGDISVDLDRIWNSEMHTVNMKPARPIPPENIKTRRDSSSSSDDQRFES